MIRRIVSGVVKVTLAWLLCILVMLLIGWAIWAVSYRPAPIESVQLPTLGVEL